MKKIGCGHKKKKKVQTHVKHPSCCWLCCPCCPVWRPCKGEFKRPWALGAEFVRLTLLGTLQVAELLKHKLAWIFTWLIGDPYSQYIPFSLVVTSLGVWGTMSGNYHEGRFAFNDVYLYNVIIRNWSQCWALYCLGPAPPRLTETDPGWPRLTPD